MAGFHELLAFFGALAFIGLIIATPIALAFDWSRDSIEHSNEPEHVQQFRDFKVSLTFLFVSLVLMVLVLVGGLLTQ